MIIRTDNSQLYDMAPPREAGRAIVWGQAIAAAVSPQNFDGTHPIYFADTEVDANTVASWLATKAPGCHWVVAKSANSFRAQPGPVVKASFTEKGLLPVNN